MKGYDTSMPSGVVAAAAAWFLCGESLGAQKLVGIGFIIVGVWLVARS